VRCRIDSFKKNFFCDDGWQSAKPTGRIAANRWLVLGPPARDDVLAIAKRQCLMVLIKPYYRNLLGAVRCDHQGSKTRMYCTTNTPKYASKGESTTQAKVL